MTTTQIIQENVPEGKRNRISSSQLSLNALFSIGLNAISLIWHTRCSFGTAILFSNALVILGYAGYTKWALQQNTERGNLLKNIFLQNGLFLGGSGKLSGKFCP